MFSGFESFSHKTRNREVSFYLPSTFTKKFLGEHLFKGAKFGEEKQVSSILFNTHNYSVPFDVLAKAEIDNCSLCDIHIEDLVNASLTQKQGFAEQVYFARCKFEDFLGVLKEFDDSLVPYFGCESRVVPINVSDKLEIQIDSGFHGYFFGESIMDLHLFPRHFVDYIRVSAVGDQEFFRNFLCVLQRHSGFFCPSEDGVLSNLDMLSRESKSTTPLSQDLKGIELEVKYNVEGMLDFQDLYNFFVSDCADFEVQREYPHILERGLMLYFVRNPAMVRKYVSFGLEKVMVSDKDDSVSGRNFLMHRPEKNRLVDLVDLDENLTIEKAVDKKKRVFWVASKDTGRIYHVAMDKCFYDGNTLRQLELEYAGATSNSVRGLFNDVITELQMLYSIVGRRYAGLIKTRLRKQEWINI